MSSSRTTWASSRASAAPRQKWMPWPNARCLWAFSRWRSIASGSSKTVSSRFAEPSSRSRLACSGRSVPATCAGHLVTPLPGEHGRDEAQQLLDRGWDQGRVVAQRFERDRAADSSSASPAAEQRRRRLVAGEQLRVHEPRDLLAGEAAVALEIDPREVAGEVVAGMLEAAVDEVEAVAPVLDEGARVPDLLVDADVAEVQIHAAERPFLHARDVLVGHAEQPEDHVAPAGRGRGRRPGLRGRVRRRRRSLRP